MRKKFEVIQGGGNVPAEVTSKFEKGTETIIATSCRIINETPKAYLICPLKWMSDHKSAVWVPKSQVIVHTQKADKSLHDIEMPTWLAEEKELDGL